MEDLAAKFEAVSEGDKYNTEDCVRGFTCRRLATSLCDAFRPLVFTKGISFVLIMYQICCFNLYVIYLHLHWFM